MRAPAATTTFSYHRALIRSAVKVALPWELAHAGLWQLRGRDVSVLGPVLIGLAYVVAGGQLVLLCRGGRPIHDRLARTIVRSA